jgi:hypothetical protein
VTYVILGSKPGIYHTEISDDVRICETYDYRFFGTTKARFVIAELLREHKIKIVDETPPATISQVPSKFLPHFPTVESARRHLQDLARTGDTVLEKQP